MKEVKSEGRVHRRIETKLNEEDLKTFSSKVFVDRNAHSRLEKMTLQGERINRKLDTNTPKKICH